MKTLFTLFILVLGMSITTLAQSISFEAGLGEITSEENWEKAQIYDLTGQNVILTSTDIDEFSGTLKVSNQYHDVFIYTNEEVGSTMVEGHNRIDYVYDGIDQDGVKLYLIVQYYEDGYLFGETYRFRFRFCYDNIWYGYYCNIVGPIGSKKLKTTPEHKTKSGVKSIS